MAATCLRQVSYTELLENEEYIHLINPYKCIKDVTCKYYRDNQPIMYARGFKNFQKRMFPDQYLKGIQKDGYDFCITKGFLEKYL